MSESQKTVTPAPGTPSRVLPENIESELLASGPSSGTQEDFGPGDVLTNPFGGFGDNKAARGESLVPGFPVQSTQEWDARSVLTLGSAAPTDSPTMSGSETKKAPHRSLKKRFSKFFSKAGSEPTLPLVEPGVDPKRLSDPVAQSVFSRLSGSPRSSPPRPIDLPGTRYATRGPPRGRRTSALASPRASGEEKHTGAGPLPVGAPAMTSDHFLEERVAQLEGLVQDLVLEIDDLRTQKEKDEIKAREDREATNRIIAQLQATLQDAVGAQFRVPIPDLLMLAEEPLTRETVPAPSGEAQGDLYAREPEF